jgi:hypothetical protein
VCGTPRRKSALRRRAINTPTGPFSKGRRLRPARPVHAKHRQFIAGNFLIVKREPAGYYNIISVSFGFQLGIQSHLVIIMFMTEKALADFQRGEMRPVAAPIIPAATARVVAHQPY